MKETTPNKIDLRSWVKKAITALTKSNADDLRNILREGEDYFLDELAIPGDISTQFQNVGEIKNAITSRIPEKIAEMDIENIRPKPVF